MEACSFTRRASDVEHLYEDADKYDDEQSESETEDFVEEQLESDEEGSEEEREEFVVKSELSESEDDQPAMSSRKRKRSRPSYLRGKNNYTWSSDIPEFRGKQSRTTYTPTPIGRAATVTSPLEAWSVFFDEEILTIILIHTNEEINRCIAKLKEKNHQPKPHEKEMDLVELRATIGLLYFSGLHKVNRTSVDALWSPYSMSMYKITMSVRRFHFLISCIRFDDKDTHLKRKTADPLANVREIWEKFINNCRSNYRPDSNCTIDNQLLSFRGKCRFKVYLPAKPERYGLKIVALNDSVTHYLYNAIPYSGTITDKEPSEPVPSYYVRKLAEPIYYSGRNITCDRWFTSIPISDTLLNEYNLTMVGEIKKNKQEIPPVFKTVQSKEKKIRFAYSDKKILVSFNPKGKKIALLLSTYHNRAKIDSETEKPEIVMFHNATKGATDRFAKKCHDFTTARRTLRWPMRFFYGMLDQANVNSFIIYNLIGSNAMMHRHDYILDLCLSLIKPLLIARLKMPTLQATLRSQIESFLEKKDLPETEDFRDLVVENKMPKTKRCGYCPTKMDRKTVYKCLQCELPMCRDHTAKICVKCSLRLTNQVLCDFSNDINTVFLLDNKFS